jgi:hypothetical protein
MTSNVWKRAWAVFPAILLAGATTVFADVDSGLVAYYPFEGNADDGSGNGNTGVANGTSVVGGMKGSAFLFDGSAYVEVPDSASLNLSNAITLQAWVKASPWRWNSRILGKGSTTDSYYLVTGDGKIKFDLYGVGYFDAPVPPADEWHMLTATYDGSKARIYVDAILVQQVAAQGVFTPKVGSLFIGNHPGIGEGFSGVLDEMRIYNRALSPSEILQLFYNVYLGRGLVAHYSLMTMLTMQAVMDRMGPSMGLRLSGPGSMGMRSV